MKKNTCKDCTDFAARIFIESIGPCTKDIEFQVFRDHLLTLRKNEASKE